MQLHIKLVLRIEDVKSSFEIAALRYRYARSGRNSVTVRES